MRLWRPRKCSTTRDVIRMFTDETNASANADGSTVNTSCGLQENPTNGGSDSAEAADLLFADPEQPGQHDGQRPRR